MPGPFGMGAITLILRSRPLSDESIEGKGGRARNRAVPVTDEQQSNLGFDRQTQAGLITKRGQNAAMRRTWLAFFLGVVKNQHGRRLESRFGRVMTVIRFR